MATTIDEKKTLQESTIQEVLDDHVSEHVHFSEEDWQPGFWKRFPWIGLVSLLGLLCLTAASVLVLQSSNGKPASEWKQWYAPNILLTIFNSGASICFAIAVGRGIAVSWWRKALLGTTIKDLHTTWSFSDSFLALLRYATSFNVAALAALAAKLAIIDGILFQRSTGTYVALGPARAINMTTYPSTSLPPLAYLTDDLTNIRTAFYNYAYDMVTWQQAQDGHVANFLYGFECNGTCATNVTNPGYKATCTTEDVYVDLYAEVVAQLNSTGHYNTTDTQIFSVSFNLTQPTVEKNYTWIGMNTTSYYPSQSDNATAICPAVITKHSCELRQVLFSYPIVVQTTETYDTRGANGSSVDVFLGHIDANGSPSNLNFTDGQDESIRFISWTSNPSELNPSSDGGIFEALRNKYVSTASIRTSGHTNLSGPWYYGELQSSGAFAYELWYSNTSFDYNCPYAELDPLPEVMYGVNTLAFITGQDPTNRPDYQDTDAYWSAVGSNTPALQRIEEVHHVTRYEWMFGAIASTMFCIILVLPVYWGFWQIGRPISLNPLEIATAFQAPLLADASARMRNDHADYVVEAAGTRAVMYAVDRGDETDTATRRHVIVAK